MMTHHYARRVALKGFLSGHKCHAAFFQAWAFFHGDETFKLGIVAANG